ncbi:MAG: hypothetical protein JWP03_4296 [Phycisphaerales bacterium]|jgi:MYXO-CTERM domain-containing protein|nr:hypothetical protein [Phycisphaerales bacterium]
MKKFAGLICLGALCSAQPLFATTVYDSQGFETSRGYVAGPLAGQVSTDTQTLPLNTKWTEFADPGNTGTVPTAIVGTAPGTPVAGGTQAVTVTRSTGTTYWGFNAAPTTPTNFALIDWDMRYQASSTNQPVYGIEVYDAGTQLASAGVNATNGHLMSLNSNLDTLDTGVVTSPADQYHHWQIAMDFVAQQYTVSVDGTVDYTAPFLAADTQFTDADIFGRGALDDGVNGIGGPAHPTTGAAYFDNYLVQTSATPEPGSLALLGLAGLGLLRRRSSR